MASTTVFLYTTAGWGAATGSPLPTAPNNGFVTAWTDKRSSLGVAISVLFYGGTPTGTLTLETSNAPGQPGTNDRYPNNNGDDALTLPSSSTAVGASAGPFQWQLANVPARWIRVRYMSSQTTAGLSANVYLTAPFESP